METEKLRSLMQRANIPSYRALATQADVSRWQIQQLRAGKFRQMRLGAIAQIASALNLSVTNLLNQLGLEEEGSYSASPDTSQLQAEALQTLESWLIQWPTIAKRAQEKGEALPAAKILPFVKPVEQLMTEWGVEAIAPIDAQIPYDPTRHQLTGPTLEPGTLVKVTHSGQMQNGKLLHRAKVKPTS